MSERQDLIEQIRNYPTKLEALVGELSDKQLTAVSIPGEWTIAQNVHHVADSHMNSYIRCKLIATEDNPTFKPYEESMWAQFSDAVGADLSDTFAILRGLHARWALFWETLPNEAWSRTGNHPESGPISLNEQLGHYVNHGEAHIDQIQRTLAAQS